MKNSIAISTGLVYKFYDDQPSRIERIKRLNPDGIEICIADPKYVLSFEPTTELIQYLKLLKRVTIHAPWIGMQYEDNPLCRKVLKKIENLYELFGAEAVVVHSGWTDDYNLFRSYNFQILVENEDYKFPQSGTPDQIWGILRSNPDIGFNFDFAHALTIWPDIVKEFIDRFWSRIVQVHMSHLSKDVKDHNFLHRDATPEAINLLQYFKDRVEMPLVLECVARTEEEIDLISNEIDFLKSF